MGLRVPLCRWTLTTAFRFPCACRRPSSTHAPRYFAWAGRLVTYFGYISSPQSCERLHFGPGFSWESCCCSGGSCSGGLLSDAKGCWASTVSIQRSQFGAGSWVGAGSISRDRSRSRSARNASRACRANAHACSRSAACWAYSRCC